LKLLIIFNPYAAYGRSAKKLTEIKSRLTGLGIQATFLATKHAGHGRELVASSHLADYDGLIAAGGDGTLFEVLNGLYEHPKQHHIPLGLLPIGTGNAFARELFSEPGNLTKAIELLHRGRTRKVDVGFFESTDISFYFLNIVSMGFAVDAGLTAKKIKFFGKSSYTMATLWQVLRLKTVPMTIEIDAEIIKRKNVFVTISNSRFTGTSFLIAPDAKIDDGQFDVIVLENISRLRLLKLFPTIYSGRHIAYPEVASYKAARVVIHSPEGLLMGPDGEFCGRSPARISCLHQDLTIFS
jgi:diacylglycerol kinase (ATP)